MAQLDSLAHIVLGGTPDRQRAHFWGGSIPWINSGAANRDIIVSASEFITDDGLSGSAAKMMPMGATVIAITGATLGKVGLLGIATAGNQSLVGVWSDDKDINAWLHFAIRSQVHELVKSATGAAQQHVNKGTIERLPVPFDRDEAVIRAWAAEARPLIDRAVVALFESVTLEALRDCLLPELLSGRIRVPEAEHAMAEVGA